MKAAEYSAKVLPNGHLEIPPSVRQDLQLRPDVQVKVILLREEETPQEQAEVAARSAEAWEKVDKVRTLLAGKDFSLTEEVIRAGQEEGASP